jgi:uncharacterized protein YvpB
MIAVEGPIPETGPAAEPFQPGPIQDRTRLGLRSAGRPWLKARRLGTKASASMVLVTLLATLGGSGGLFDGGAPLSLQSRATSFHQRLDLMRAQGIPGFDLAALEQEWAYTQANKFMGVATVFWLPGASAMLDRWQAQAAAIWARDLTLYRAAAVAADHNLHLALGTESLVERKDRINALAMAATPAEFTALRASWDLEARLIPIDERIAAATGALANQALQAKNLGIRSDPSADSLARADLYSKMQAEERIGRAEFLTRNLVAVGADLQGRLDAAVITQQALTHATDQINTASLYGIDLSSYQPRIDLNRGAYANVATVAEFNGITGDLNQIASVADNAVYAAISATHIISGVAFYYQNRSLSCEEAATSMALTHQGIYVSQDQILAELGADRRGMYVDGNGRVRWGNPYQTFVGNVNGSESNYTGYGTFYPPLVRIAQAHGARILAYGSMSAATIYARLIAGHPVVVFATWDWAWHPRRDYLSYDGQWIPWIGPYYASHVYTAVGVSPGAVLINDPLRGQYWVGKADFEASYSDFNEAIVFA